MVLAAEYTAATLAGWVAVALVVGLVIGWLLRPWLVGERLRDDYETRLRDERSDRTDAETQVEVTAATLADLKAELDVMRGDTARLNAELATSRNRVANLEAQVASLAVEKDAEISRLSTEASKVSSLEVALGERDARIAALEASEAERDVETARAEAVAEAADAARARLQGNEAKLAAARERAEEAEAARAKLQTQRAGDAARLAESAARIAELEDRITQLSRTLAAPVATAPDREQSQVASGSDRPNEVLRQDEDTRRGEAPTTVGGVTEMTVAEVAAPSSPADDLKAIRGIGPAIERKLKAMGISTFEQIANLTSQQKADIGDALGSFSDRIERDDWAGSAARLHAAKYGVSAGG